MERVAYRNLSAASSRSIPAGGSDGHAARPPQIWRLLRVALAWRATTRCSRWRAGRRAGAVAWARLFAGGATARRPGQRLARAHELGPTFIKLGQACRPAPTSSARRSRPTSPGCRTTCRRSPATEARRTIEAELGKPVDDAVLSFDEPVAAASIAQVHFAVTTDGRRGGGQGAAARHRGAFARDLDLFSWLAELVERTQPRLRRLQAGRNGQDLRRVVRVEMDLRLEAAAAPSWPRTSPAIQLPLPAVDWRRTAGAC